MSKTAMSVSIIVVLALIGASYLYTSRDSGMMQKDDAAMMKAGTDSTGVMPGDVSDTKMTDDAMKKDDAMMQKDDAMMKKDSMMEGDVNKDAGAMTRGSYESYMPEKLALATSGDVVLFFHAAWCPICNALEKDINAHVSAIPSGVSILKVDFDTATALRKKYGVTLQHTFVQVRADGSMIAKWSDSSTLASIVSKIQ